MCDSASRHNIDANLGIYNTSHVKNRKRKSTHANHTLVQKRYRTCGYAECTIRPNFNYEGHKGKFCTIHKEAGMVNVKDKRCKHTECTIRPSFNYEGRLNGIFCDNHKEKGMVNVLSKSKHCEHIGCTSIHTFNFEGQKRGRFCYQHKEVGMVDVRSNRCEYTGCESISPSFNFEGYKPKFCVTHKETGMVDVKSKRCKHTGCTSRPTFNFEEENKPMFCGTHKQSGMVDVKNKRCEHTGCWSITPSFNFEGQKQGQFCRKHKKDGMIDVRSKRCEHPGCKTQPFFNWEGQSQGRFCVAHKELGMVDVKSKRCVQCPTHPIFGIPGKKSTHCASHKTSGMIAYPKRKCEVDQCKSYALYGMNSIPTHCENHRAPQHINLVQRDCVVCGVLEYVDDDQKCSRCSEYLTKRLHLRKQRQVKSWIEADPSLSCYESYDKQIEGGSCGKERPDMVWDTPTHKVILEVDEFQHRDRPCECEQTRMINVTQAFGMPCLWIRYNPDNFQGQKASLKEKDRKDLLLRVLMDSMSGFPKNVLEFLRVKHLFFDGFNLGNPIPCENLLML